jgi:hypothetical protein
MLDKTQQSYEVNIDDDDNAIGAPTTKHRDIFMCVYNVSKDKALHRIYSDQTGQFPQKSSF